MKEKKMWSSVSRNCYLDILESTTPHDLWTMTPYPLLWNSMLPNVFLSLTLPEKVRVHCSSDSVWRITMDGGVIQKQYMLKFNQSWTLISSVFTFNTSNARFWDVALIYFTMKKSADQNLTGPFQLNFNLCHLVASWTRHPMLPGCIMWPAESYLYTVVYRVHFEIRFHIFLCFVF